ncbi:MAG: hypothetical protein AAF927_30455 [Bacteroidota bacterium]
MNLLTLFIASIFFSLFGNAPSSKPTPPADLPENYQLLYHQDFSLPQAIADFEMTDERAWKISGEKKTLELYGKSEYRSRVRSPFNIALLKHHFFGSFVLEVDLAQSGREYGHRDLCLFFGAQSSTNFYYVHIASVADDNANNIFLVNDEPRTNIAQKTTSGTSWGETNSWHKARIKRDIEAGTIKVYFDDMSSPIMEATDKHFDIGRIGFGSFDDTGRFDNIRIWGEKTLPPKTAFFK